MKASEMAIEAEKGMLEPKASRIVLDGRKNPIRRLWQRNQRSALQGDEAKVRAGF